MKVIIKSYRLSSLSCVVEVVMPDQSILTIPISINKTITEDALRKALQDGIRALKEAREKASVLIEAVGKDMEIKE